MRADPLRCRAPEKNVSGFELCLIVAPVSYLEERQRFRDIQIQRRDPDHAHHQ